MNADNTAYASLKDNSTNPRITAFLQFIRSFLFFFQNHVRSDTKIHLSPRTTCKLIFKSSTHLRSWDIYYPRGSTKVAFSTRRRLRFSPGVFFFFIEILFIPFPATIYFPRWSFGNAFLEEHLSFYITCNGYKTLDGYKKKNTRRWREGEAARC